MIQPEKILAGLNRSQKEAVTFSGGPILVIAGPGSGKTRSLAHRIAYLMTAGVPPTEILAVTFTNKAAEEMRQRVAALLRGHDQSDEIDQSAASGGLDKNVQPRTPLSSSPFSSSSPLRMPFIGTFHSFSASVLREEARHIGYRREFAIYDEGDSEALIKEITKELGLDAKTFGVSLVSAIISNLKTDLIAWDEYVVSGADDYFPSAIAKIYKAYQERLKSSNVMDFDDLIFNVVKLFQSERAALERWQEKCKYIHIDEYQDTNTSQYELTRLLAAKHRNLFAIGDDAQSIYGFRRADYRNILNFERDWPEAKVIFLEENYRSTPEILEAANRVIANNQSQKPKKLWTQNPSGSLPLVAACLHERAEAEFIAEEIASLCREEGMAFKDCAVLYRTNAQSRALEEAMIEGEIPYAIVGGIRFFQRREVKDLAAYLRYLQNKDDLLSLKRIINVPARGISPKTFSAYLNGATEKLPPKDREKLRGFEDTMAKLLDGMAEKSLAEFIRFLIHTVGYEEYLEDFSKGGEGRVENIRELASIAKKYDAWPIGEAMVAMLEEMALMSDQSEVKKNDDRAKLMTLHAAKGLEFPAVFITGLEEGILPHSKSISGGRQELEEERRLYYVGMTRAKQKLYLTWTLQRTIFGERQINMPSRFLRELPPEILEQSGADADNLLIAEKEE